MSTPPEYFERIREDASETWDRFKEKPSDEGPWKQLFMQVKSPKHVLSELLQNADDAGATYTSVQIENGVFIFRHDGMDFVEEHFDSLCKFGYSNKRVLHTIGFRGIGFKSTFSLGDRVELYTPTLSIAFDSHRFTEPIWLNKPLRNDNLTEVRVKIKNEKLQDMVEKNLQEWLDSPVSLLFFKNIRHLNIQDNKVQWRIIEPGPVENTEWVELVNKDDKPYLIARSAFEPFPSDALTEIKQQCVGDIGEDTEFPPCQVEIVLGANGRLFVVLPTEVETSLPFVCNAPFIQDPQRTTILDPRMSTTNSWLLERIGRLAGSIMLQWLEQNTIDTDERSKAYDLLPEIESDDSSLEGICAITVIDNFEKITENQNYLLTSEGDLKPVNQTVIIPNEIIEIWSAKQAVSFLDNLKRPALTHHISKTNLSKLIDRQIVEEITKDQILDTLKNTHLPKPKNWYQLFNLWVYVASKITVDKSYIVDSLHIVPVQGEKVLYTAKDVVRFRKKKTHQSDEDWHFLSKHLQFLDNGWILFLYKQTKGVKDNKDNVLEKKMEHINSNLKSMKLNNSSTANKIMDRAAVEFFRCDEITISDCIRLTQIAAKIKADTYYPFQYVTEDKCLRSIEDIVLFDDDGTLEQIIPHDWSSKHLLHSGYYKDFKSCSRDDWINWISSKHTGLSTFVPIKQIEETVFDRDEIKHEISTRGFKYVPSFPYLSHNFRIADWDFDKALWKHWNTLAKENDGIWVQIVKCIFSQNTSFWSETVNAKVFQKSSHGNEKPIACNPLRSAWISKLRKLPCIPDTHGFYRKPTEIFRRTPETESLVDVEPFIDFRYDNELTRPLLIRLGVCDTPTGPDRLLDRLRALSKADNPPVNEVDKWYRRLDQMLESCSTGDRAKIQQAFNDEKMILAESGNWSRLSEVFLFSDEEDVPGAEIIRSSVKDLTIWRKIGVNERLTADLVIEWLKELPTGQKLSKDNLPRVRKILPRHSFRIWNECGHWLNLAGEWIPVENIEYSILTSSQIKWWSHLHEWVKQKTADFQILTGELLQDSPFSEVSTLANQIENRFHQNPSSIDSPEKRVWLNRFGEDICRIVLDDEDNTSQIRSLAADLAETVWQKTPGLETIPYIDGIPAGTPTNADVIWSNKILYFDDIPNAKLARQVPDSLGEMFNYRNITAALHYCFGRNPQDVTEYLEENFNLRPRKDDKTSDIDDDIIENGVISQEEIDGESQNNPAHVCDDEQSKDGKESKFVITGKVQGKTPETDGEIIKKPSPPKPNKVGIMERFATDQGYQKEADNNFFHSNGSRIRKSSNDNIFPWEKLSPTGEVICEYWPKDHCLQREPLKLDAEVWSKIDKFPNTCAFVLSDMEGKPIELDGQHLKDMFKDDKIKLYPATYRIVYEHDN